MNEKTWQKYPLVSDRSFGKSCVCHSKKVIMPDLLRDPVCNQRGLLGAVCHIQSLMAFGAGYWVLVVTEHWVLGTEHWVLGTEHWVLNTGYWTLSTGHHSVLVVPHWADVGELPHLPIMDSSHMVILPGSGQPAWNIWQCQKDETLHWQWHWHLQHKTTKITRQNADTTNNNKRVKTWQNLIKTTKILQNCV